MELSLPAQPVLVLKSEFCWRGESSQLFIPLFLRAVCSRSHERAAGSFLESLGSAFLLYFDEKWMARKAGRDRRTSLTLPRNIVFHLLKIHKNKKIIFPNCFNYKALIGIPALWE